MTASVTPGLIHILSSSFRGGREEYALDICRGFSEMGWRVSVFTRDVAAIDTPFRLHGVRVRHLPLGGYADLASAISLAHCLRRSELSTVVHTHTHRDAFLALLARKLSLRKDIRVVHTCHRVKPVRNTALSRRIYRNLHTVIFVSRLAHDSFMSTWPGGDAPLDAARTRILPSSIYMPGFTPVPPPAAGPTVAMFSGRVVAGKGVETLISALPALRGKRLRARIAGPGDPDFIDSMKRLADRAGVMDMIDWRNGREDIHALMDNCHFGVIPSGVPEAFSLPTAMFMAHGRPVICSSNGAQSEYLTGGKEGFFITPGDVEGMKRMLTLMVSGAVDVEAMGHAARRRFESDLNWERFASRLAAIYRDKE